jgi:S1-C subfamily serine protease
VASESPADRAGILLGDIIVTVEGSSIESMQSLQAALDGENIGKSIVLDVVRGGHLVEVSVVVGEKPKN